MLAKIHSDPQIQLVVALASLASLFLAVPFWGVVLLMALGVTVAPWPMLAALASLFVVIPSWLVLWGRLKSDFLYVFDIFFSIGLFALVIGTHKAFSVEANYTWAMLTYGSAFFMIVLHYMLAMLTIIGMIRSTSAELLSEARPA